MNFDTKMPLSELYKSVNGKQKASDISYIPNDEFVELIWEKGQIMMQGQSSKARKTPVSSNFQFHTPKFQEKEGVLDVPMVGPCGEMGSLNQDDDDMVPWLNYDDYCCDLLPEISGVTVNEPAMLNRGSCNKGSLNSSRSTHLFSDPSLRSGVSEIGSSNCATKPRDIVRKDPHGLLNFSHFSRPAAMARANLQNNSLLADSGSCGLHIMKSNEPQKETGLVSQPSLDSGKQASNPCTSKPAEQPCKPQNVVVEKSIEPVGASSSVCSGNNSGERASNDLTKNCKRKSRDTEDFFECQSQDIEEESLGTKTARGGTGSKRSRAAEVHNLSERRRRDRINEKMRALQELIPNCNKVDKASMLDEAIEYLKTLQLQVQIMSMGSGLCMPPMMFPHGMHFSPMGMSYGMGMGMGMGDMFPPPTLPSPPISGLDRSRFQVYGHPGPMLFSQPPVPGFPMNPSVQLPTSTQPQVANNQASTSVDKKDEAPEARGGVD